MRSSARAAPMAERLARSHGLDLLVSHPGGDLRRLDGRPALMDETLSSAIQHATRLALRVVAQAEPGSALVEVASASADGEPFTLRVHAPDVDGDLLPITLERSRAVITAEELARHGLTRRQGEVMSLVLSGATNGGVASAWGSASGPSRSMCSPPTTSSVCAHVPGRFSPCSSETAIWVIPPTSTCVLP